MADKEQEKRISHIEESNASIFLGFGSETAIENMEMPESDKSSAVSVTTAESDQGPRIEFLWNFQCPVTKGYSVTSIDWNKSNRVSLLCCCCCCS